MRIRGFLIGSVVSVAVICSSYAQYPDATVLLQSLGVVIDRDGNLTGNHAKERWEQFWSFLLKSKNDGKLEPFEDSFKGKGSVLSECCPYGFTESEYGVDTLCGGFLAATGLYYDGESARQIVDAIASRQFFDGVFGKLVTSTLIRESGNEKVYTSLYCRGTFKEYENLLREAGRQYLPLSGPLETDVYSNRMNWVEYGFEAFLVCEKMDAEIEYLKENVSKY